MKDTRVPDLSPYEADLADQPDALRRLAATPLPSQLAEIDLDRYPRIIITGMGSSHFAGLPLWRTLVRDGRPAWWTSTTQLLDCPELVTSDALVIMASQSGQSGEIVAAVQGSALPRPRTLIGITNEPESPLGQQCDVRVDLESGPEATVSAKSYLNTLATYERMACVFRGQDLARVDGQIRAAANDLGLFDCTDQVARVVQAAVSSDGQRLAFVGKNDDAATALFGGLILKEAARVAAEGFIGGDFRHGPLEIAGAGLTAVLLTAPPLRPEALESLAQLADELTDTGAQVLTVGTPVPAHVPHVTLPARGELAVRVLATNVVQVLSVQLAHAKGLVPGEFRFGTKVTSTL